MADTSFLYVIDSGLRVLLYTKFKDALGLTTLQNDSALFPREVAMRKIAERRGKVAMEFLNVWRTETNVDWSRQRTGTARHGFLTKFTSPSKSDIFRTYAVPVELNYDFWCWSKDPEKLNKVTELYLFWQHRNPNLDLEYNDEYPVELDLHFGNVMNESPVEMLYDKGLYYVARYPVKVDGWVFTDDTVKTVKKIVVTLWIENAGGEDTFVSQEEYVLTEES
jgi:hypothetical protein